MRKALHRKIITCYILIGILSFFLATAGGSHFVETYLEEELGERLYDSASHLASDDVTIEQLSASDRSSLQKAADLLSVSEDAELLILDDTENCGSGSFRSCLHLQSLFLWPLTSGS